MIPLTLRNLVCVTGLALGLSLIGSANLAQAETLPCAPEDTQGVTEEGLPILCERMVITAPRLQSATSRLRDFAFIEILTPLELAGEGLSWTLPRQTPSRITN